MVEQPFHKDIKMGVNHGPPLCKRQLESQLERRKTETGSKEGRLPDFLDPRALQLCLCVILQDKGRTPPEEVPRKSGPPPWFKGGGRHHLGFNRAEGVNPKPWGQGLLDSWWTTPPLHL